MSGVPLPVLLAIGQNESGFQQSARSPAGAIGIMQLMGPTAQALGIDPESAEQNVIGGAIYLRDLYKKFGSWPLTIAAFNAGPGAVESHGNQVPPYAETRKYVQNVLATMQSLGM